MIYIDASRYSNTEKRTGVENYSYYLLNELVKQIGEEITLLTPRPLNLNAKQKVMPFPRLWTLVRLSWEIWRNKNINNLFVPSHVLPLIHPKNSIITIHDVVFKYSPESYSLLSRLYLNWATKFAVKHAAKIITPSEATKKDLVQFYKANPNKIHVIPLGYKQAPANPRQSEVEKFLKNLALEPKNFFLYLGRIEYKKNTDTLIRAFAKFTQNNKTIKLVIAGFLGHGGQKIVNQIPAELKSRIVLSGYVTESTKMILLNNALCFIYPSRFEGFGLPLLEAMNTGVPIIASDIPTSQEVAKDSAIYFKKESPDELANLMLKISEDSDLRLKLSEKGYERVTKYSWNKCAQMVKNILI